MNARTLGLLLAGGLGGVIAWLISEPFAPKNLTDVNWGRFEQIFGLAAGIMIGLLVGGLSGYSQGSKSHLVRGLFFGALLGAVGGTFGVSVGSMLYKFLGSIPFIGRGFGWALFGGFIGLAEGAVGRSMRRAFIGLIGGLLGGFAGGIMFDVIGTFLGPIALMMNGVQPGQQGEVGTIPRAVALFATGAGIGFFIGIIESMSRSAWVRLSLGRNEGKEWLIDAPQNVIGRSEGAHVPLFGDPQVAPQHAVIVRQGGQYVLHDQGSPIGTGVNGQRVQSAVLSNGDEIQLGNLRLQFMMRSGKAVRTGNEAYQGMPVAMVPGPASMQPMPPAQNFPGISNPTVAMQPQSTGAPTVAMTATRPATLVATNGPIVGQRFEVFGPMDIGRESTGIGLPFDTMASRRHAQVAPQPDGVMISDLGSTNGTLINGQRIQSQIARRGDTVQIGNTIFRVE